MKILLDTHILLWALSGDGRLPEKARAAIEDDNNEVCYSILSIWEIELKHLLHPDQMPASARDIKGYCEESGFHRVFIAEDHIFMLHTLQRPAGAKPHKDPFDRLLICQAKSENMLLLTHDRLFMDYQETCICVV